MNLREITPSTADVSPQTPPRAGLTFKEKPGYNPPYHIERAGQVDRVVVSINADDSFVLEE